MRAFVRIVLPALLVVGMFAVPTAAFEPTATEAIEAVTETPTETPTPVYENLTFFLHGTERVGEADASTLGHMKMDTTAPTASETASRQILNYVRGPNTKCSGSWLFPTWDAEMEGQVQGNVKVTLQTLTHPNNSFVVELFADGAGACNETYVPPVASKKVSFPVGQATSEVVFENVDFPVVGQLTLMVRPPDGPTVTSPDPTVPSQSTLEPHQGRVFYDSTTVQSRVELQCLLPEGKTTCTF
jgi:hypothetical protein